MNILFICKYNRFRSRIAEAYFKKINKNKQIKVKSAGLIKGSSVNKYQVRIAKKFNLNIKGNPKPLSSKLLKQQDLIIIVANDVPKEIFRKTEYDPKGEKVINLNIKDASSYDTKEVEKIIKIIIEKINKLVKKLDTKK